MLFRSEIWIEPTLDDLLFFRDTHIRGCSVLSVDIETSGKRITCIGLAPDPLHAIVIPFDDERTKTGSYWVNAADEKRAWEIIAEILADPSIPKLFHNGAYDIPFLWRSMRIKVLGATHDTMLLMHSLQPESLKSLGYCGSLFADECAWKNLGAHHKTIKKDDA